MVKKRSKALLILFGIICVIFVFCSNNFAEKEDAEMGVLKIKWQRFVYADDKTCERCGETGREVRNAIEKLKTSLAPLGIKVVLEEKALDSATCAKDISQSNRIWIAEKPLEEWLGAAIGKSPCSTCCGDIGENIECRTVEIDGEIYEAIPTELIVQAGLLAAAEIVKEEPKSATCCGSKIKSSKEKSCCD